ncbi:tRNA(Ile)-lysidine synthase [Sphingobium sp. SYK-6]|uniref:tRNA lysidine(34) synthetase TilS n=1 Tax=Sphingobium sp. (strain NBRC 103272 / SYK-6) TaxID=627192 RepID=UPI00022772E9|nr:tRNA lysidine(34) synthetase TilS [Sphingobium sp. SYK-6]BAK67030.1 tRNA(Ile)-lysidine synthase [Sphingobium sp. SYK-6]
MPDALADRLKAETHRLLGRPLATEERIGIAVSGGADSMALLALAYHAWPGRVEAATVDHGLRAAARGEAAMVARWCEGQGIPHVILGPPPPLEGNLQAAARAARYALLEEWRGARGLAWLMTAHQADDQIETILLRLGRGAGVGGLASVRARRGTLLRPLLGTRRAALRDFCERAGIPFIDDPSNEDPRFDRVRMRTALEGSTLIDPGGLARSVDALAQADSALGWMTDTLAAESIAFEAGSATLRRTDLPPEILRRLLLRMIAHCHPKAEKPRGPSLDQALLQLLDGRTVALADCVVSGGAQWTVRRAAARNSR